MAVSVTRETEEMIREMGVFGKLVERCDSCKKPTRWWANNGDYPLCPPCAETHIETAKDQ